MTERETAVEDKNYLAANPHHMGTIVLFLLLYPLSTNSILIWEMTAFTTFLFFLFYYSSTCSHFVFLMSFEPVQANNKNEWMESLVWLERRYTLMNVLAWARRRPKDSYFYFQPFLSFHHFLFYDPLSQFFSTRFFFLVLWKASKVAVDERAVGGLFINVTLFICFILYKFHCF